MAYSKLDQIKNRISAATPGPWDIEVWRGDSDNVWAAVGPRHKEYDDEDEIDPDCEAYIQAHKDARFIARCRTDIPYLLATIEKLKGTLEDINAGRGDALPGGIERCTIRALMARAERALIELEREEGAG